MTSPFQCHGTKPFFFKKVPVVPFLFLQIHLFCLSFTSFSPTGLNLKPQNKKNKKTKKEEKKNAMHASKHALFKAYWKVFLFIRFLKNAQQCEVSDTRPVLWCCHKAKFCFSA